MRVAVLALDGFPLHLLREIGKTIPNVSRLMDQGTWGKLESTIPFVTSTAWTSFMTGKNPGKTGVLGFFSRESSDPADIGKLTAGFSIKDRTLWRVLSDAGLKVGVLGVPMTYRPEAVNGFMVSGFPLPRNATDYTYPADLRGRLEGRGWNFSDIPTQAYSKERLDPFYEELKARVKQKTDAILYLLESFELDFFMAHYFETDKVLHEFLNFRYIEHCSGGDYRRYHSYVDDFMVHLGTELGRVLSALPSSTNVFVVSDHGLSPGNHVFLADTWLLRGGYMKVRRSPGSFARHLIFRLGITPELGFRLLPEKASGRLLQTFMGEYWEMQSEAKPRAASSLSRLLYSLLLDKRRDIDWKRSSAYSFGGYGVFNVYLRSERMSKQDLLPLKNEVMEKLQQLRYNDATVFDKVYSDEQVYVWKGDRHDIPDIVAYDEHSEYVAQANPSFFTSNRVVTRKYANKNEANHDRDGIFIACGPEIARQETGDDLSISDIFPTILHYFDLSIEKDVDGRAAVEIFRSDSAASGREPRYRDSVGGSQTVSAFNKDEEAEITEKLRRMGYV